MLYLIKKKRFNHFDIIHKTEDMDYNVYCANEQYLGSIKSALEAFMDFVEMFKFEEDTFEEYLNNFVVLAEAEDSFDIKDLENQFPEYFL